MSLMSTNTPDTPYTGIPALRRYKPSVAPDGLYLRSEEHTSELQSHHDLVCRLLLEKKKNQRIKNTICLQPLKSGDLCLLLMLAVLGLLSLSSEEWLSRNDVTYLVFRLFDSTHYRHV